MDEQVNRPGEGWPVTGSAVAAGRRTAYALRELLTQLAEADASPEQLEELAEQLESVAATWRAIPERTAIGAGGGNGWRSLMLPDVSFDYSDPQRLVMNTRIGIGFEGPPGRVHGGVVSYLFDNMVGQITMHCGFGITLTARLSVSYAAATPIDTDLRLTAWVDRHEGRKFWVGAELEVDGVVTATCEALMIAPRGDLFDGAASARRR